MAEARSAVSEPLVCKVMDRESANWDVIAKAWLKGGIRKYYRTRYSFSLHSTFISLSVQ
jgi:hypothetical protein